MHLSAAGSAAHARGAYFDRPAGAHQRMVRNRENRGDQAVPGIPSATRLQLHRGDAHKHALTRVLSVRDLTFFGIAAIIGAGSFSSLGDAVFRGGPGVVVLFIICGIACAFTALCYSDFASRIPVVARAYTYAYASFGEVLAWIIGWALLMEYSIGNIYVAFSWSDYFTSLLAKLSIHVPDYLACSYREAHQAFTGKVNNPD